MKVRCFFLLILFLTTNSFAGLDTILEVDQYSENELIISVDLRIHLDYGLAYPLTYQINIPSGSTNLNVYKK